LLEINLLGPHVDLPVYVPDVIPRRVGPMLRELDGDALIRRTMHAAHQAFYDQSRAQLERSNLRQHARVEIRSIIGNGLTHVLLPSLAGRGWGRVDALSTQCPSCLLTSVSSTHA